jgi:hypothetical protein
LSHVGLYGVGPEAGSDIAFVGKVDVFPSVGNWTAVRSCADKENYVLARRYGAGGVQCMGPGPMACSWFRDEGCQTLAEGEPEPDESREVGYVCEQIKGECELRFFSL